MRTVVWIIGAVVLVDVAIVAWFAVRELLDRRRVRREIEELDALWRSAEVPRLQLVPSGGPRSSAPSPSGRSEVPVLAGRPSARRASFVAFAAATSALVVVLALDASVPRTERASPGGTSPDRTWTFEPDLGGDRAVDPSGAVPSPMVQAAEPPPSLSGEPPPGGPDPATGGTAPEEVAADPRSADEIVVAWGTVEEAVAYLIERWDAAPDAPAGWTVIGTTGSDATAFVDDDLEPGTTYYYRVSALTEEGPATSDVVSATTLPGPPDAPTIVASSNGGSVEVGWDDVASETGYRIERSDAGGPWVAIATVGQDATVHVDDGLAEGVTYGYRVVATNESGDSPPSNVVTLTVSDEATSTDPGPGSEEPGGGGTAASGEGAAGPGITAPRVAGSAEAEEPVSSERATGG